MQTTQPVRERSRNIIRNPRVRDHIFSSWVDSSNTPRLLREFLVSVCPGEYSHITLPWSTSPVEGHINRLKMLKRQMFGRARLDLLSRRFLRAPRGDQAQTRGQRTPTQAHAAAA